MLCSEHPSCPCSLWAAGCELQRCMRLPGSFFCLFHTFKAHLTLHKMPIPLKSPKQNWSKTWVMLGMSFPVVDWGVKLCFQSQHYKWALLTEQIAAKSISLQRRWCSGSWKGHRLNHLQIIYCQEGNATAEGWEGEESDVHISIQLSSQHSSLLLWACGTSYLSSHMQQRNLCVWEIIFPPWDGDLYSWLNLHKFTSHKVLLIKPREKEKMSFYWWVWWEADAQGGLEGRRAKMLCAVRMIQHVQILKHQEAKELQWSVTGIVWFDRQ